MLEKDIENLIALYPDEFFPKSGFKLIGQQVKLGRCYADIIFEDKFQRKIIVEVKRGILSRDASGQIMEYYGLLKSERTTDFIELILCANVIPAERKTFLETAGIECKEVGINRINQLAEKFGYNFIDSPKIQEQKLKHQLAEEPEKVWIFQANGSLYNIQEMLDDEKVVTEFHWGINQYKDKIKNGHIGLIWLSGKNAGIYAVVEITSDPEYCDENNAEKKYWINKDRKEEEKEKKLRVKMRLTRNLTNNLISRDRLKGIEGLQNLSIIKQPFAGTNFKVTTEEWNLIKELIES